MTDTIPARDVLDYIARGQQARDCALGVLHAAPVPYTATPRFGEQLTLLAGAA